MTFIPASTVTYEAPPLEDEPVQEQIEVTQVTYPVGCNNYRHLVEKYDWDVEVAMNIMAAESGCNPNAINNTDNHRVCMGSFGLFQISCHSGQVLNPEQNIRIAYEVKYLNGGWRHWSVCKNGMVNCKI